MVQKGNIGVTTENIFPVIKKLSNWKFIPEDWTKDAIKRDRKELFDD